MTSIFISLTTLSAGLWISLVQQVLFLSATELLCWFGHFERGGSLGWMQLSVGI